MQRINPGVPRDVSQLHGPLFLGTLMLAPRHRPGHSDWGEALKLDEMSGMLRHVSWYLMGASDISRDQAFFVPAFGEEALSQS